VCTWAKIVLLHCADSGKYNTWNTLSSTRDPSHAFPTLTNSVLSASCGVHSFTDTFALTQFLLQTAKYKFSLNLYSTQILSYDTHNILLYIITVLGPQNKWHLYRYCLKFPCRTCCYCLLRNWYGSRLTFKYINFFNRDSQTVGSKDEASGHTLTERQFKQYNNWLPGEEICR
jgi:hypothetical protein